MNISSVIVHPRPGLAQAVAADLVRLDGVEVAAVSPEGKIIATIETEGDAETVRTFEAMAALPQVMSVSMVYHHKEDQPDAEIGLPA